MKRFLAALSLLGLAACATPAYSPAHSPTAQGYSEQMISQDRWRVRYTGSRSMTSAQVQDYALMRAAQLTLEQGALWFEVVDRNTDQDRRQRYSIETDFGTDYAVRRSCGLLGCTTEAVPVLTRTRTERVDTRTVYEHSLEIVMGYGAQRDAGAQTYDARNTFSTLKAQLG